ncbi:MAG TPA: sn-glycerol-3-phosphate ABC transporter ATP-binding protein UgpC [Phycisphaerae bacterium]|nr:sn-glycerol-3-phosphate ABC transporter ATP-binding protein UgpC [Phycisphaerae bacterium]
MARVTLEKVTKVYAGNSKPSVGGSTGIDLDIQDREFIVLVGPSGCGKSTTLRMVAGLEEISGGTIRIGDRIVNDVPPKDRDIAMVFQNYALYPHMTVYKNMAFGLQLRRKELGLSREQIHERVLEIARVLGISDYLDRKPKALSGGQRQRVAVGRAIVRNPKAFLFDEPLSNLDAKLRVETRAEIKKLHLRLQTTTIYVTHDQEEAMTLGDRIVVMKEGQIQQCAPPLEVYEHPVNRFVASFVGTPPMNFLDGRIATQGSEGTCFTFGNQRIRLNGDLARAASKYLGKPLVLGVRPESLSPANTGKFVGEENRIVVKVNVVEPLGDRVDIHLGIENDVEALPLVCRADAYEFGKLQVGSIIRIHLDLGRVHLFEPGEPGVNVTMTQEHRHAAA